ncbi:hypothetical protein KC953_00645, partial [Candidatus Saccharibacteria bacterium]|nr:hypothetical protein [Candidatus Saccharibacteria bacterium]
IAALFGRTETPVIDAFEPALKYLVELGYDRTSQATTVPFQPGSSIVRFLNSVPEFTGTLKEGVEDLRTGRQAVVSEFESNEPVALKPTSQKVAPVAARRESRVLPTDASDRVSLRHSGSGKQADSGLKRASRTNVKRDVSRPHTSKKHSSSKARSSHHSRS